MDDALSQVETAGTDDAAAVGEFVDDALAAEDQTQALNIAYRDLVCFVCESKLAAFLILSGTLQTERRMDSARSSLSINAALLIGIVAAVWLLVVRPVSDFDPNMAVVESLLHRRQYDK